MKTLHSAIKFWQSIQLIVLIGLLLASFFVVKGLVNKNQQAMATPITIEMPSLD